MQCLQCKGAITSYAYSGEFCTHDCATRHAEGPAGAGARAIRTPECHGYSRTLTLSPKNAHRNAEILFDDLKAAQARVDELKRIIAINARYLAVPIP